MIWIMSFVLAVFIVEMYYWGYPHERKLIESERVSIYFPLTTIYGAHLAGILAAWFVKPFRKLGFDRFTERKRFTIALIATLLYNFLVLYFLSLSHWSKQPTLTSAQDAMTLGKYLSILIGPVNLYYFGIKKYGSGR